MNYEGLVERPFRSMKKIIRRPIEASFFIALTVLFIGRRSRHSNVVRRTTYEGEGCRARSGTCLTELNNNRTVAGL
jgi:hypothetical protein